MGEVKRLNVAIAGATGAVGQEIVQLLNQRNFPVGELRLLASERSAGKKLVLDGHENTVQLLSNDSFDGIDIAFFSAGASRSKQFVPVAIQKGAFVVDNSSALRMDPKAPLVVTGVNDGLIEPQTQIAAVPNCSAIILLTAIFPLLSLAPIDRLIVSTYQSASGGGAAMMQRLKEETEYYLQEKEHPEQNHSYPPYAFNLFSHNTAINEQGANEEEAKMIAESRKILGNPDLKMNVTCVRVPVLRAHTESVTVEFDRPHPSLESMRNVLNTAPNVTVVDDRDKNHFPTPRLASGQGDVLVGRIRHDPSNPNAISMLIAGDQLLRGAALTAVEIAERWLSLQ